MWWEGKEGRKKSAAAFSCVELYSFCIRRRRRVTKDSRIKNGSSFCTISTSERDEILRTYIVTPTDTAGPETTHNIL